MAVGRTEGVMTKGQGSQCFSREYGSKVAAHYGEIRANLKRKGTPIGVNDLHISGHARSAGLTIVTHNPREGERVEVLRRPNCMG